jgi:hypothetical protein
VLCPYVNRISWDLQTEAGSRTIIDQVIQEAIIALHSSGVYAYMFPELIISAAKDNPVGIRYNAAGATSAAGKGQYMTFLTGSIDYLALGFNEIVDKATEKDMLSQKTLSSLLDEKGALKKHLSSLGPGRDDHFSCLRLIDIEAKKRIEEQKTRKTQKTRAKNAENTENAETRKHRKRRKRRNRKNINSDFTNPRL